MRDGQGFYDYAGVDVDAYRMQRLEQLRDRLALLGLLPRCGSALNGAGRRGAGRLTGDRPADRPRQRPPPRLPHAPAQRPPVSSASSTS